MADLAEALEFERPRDIRQLIERNKNELGRVLIKMGLVSNGDRCPLYPRKRTCAVHQRMSALCQKRTFEATRLEFVMWPQ